MVVEALKHEGVTTIFGLPGGSVLALYDALRDSGIRHVLMRHEQAAAHAADGYARVGAKPGVCLATSGPGATNLITGLTNAYLDSAPVISITGQVGTNLIGLDAFQEADVFGLSTSCTKHSYLVKTVEQIPSAIRHAFHIATTGRRGPVAIDIPKDLFTAVGSFSYPPALDLPGYNPVSEPDAQDVRHAVEALAAARRPVILAGQGVIAADASAELLALAEQLSIPVLTTLLGIGSIPHNHPMHVGMIGMHGSYPANRAAVSCDLVLALGTRFGDRSVGVLGKFAHKAKVIHVDIDESEIGKNVPVDIGIVGDVKAVLRGMLSGLSEAKPAPNQTAIWLQQISKWAGQDEAGSPTASGRLGHRRVIEHIWQVFNSSGIVATDVGQHQMWAALCARATAPRQFVTSGGLGTMGFGFPAALGAKAARPDLHVVLIAGDGSFQMNMQEIASMVEHNLPVIVCVMNNRSLGMVRQWQNLFYGDRYMASDLVHNPDFVKIADAYGVPAQKVTSEDQIRQALLAAMHSKRGYLIEFVVDTDENVLPMTIGGQAVTLAKGEAR